MDRSPIPEHVDAERNGTFHRVVAKKNQHTFTFTLISKPLKKLTERSTSC